MTDLLIGLAVLAGMSLFVYAIVRAGRQQRRQRVELFRAFAESRGWKQVSGDDPDLRQRLEPFEAIGSYRSPSLGKVAPQHAVTGEVAQGHVWVFWHTRRISEGDALQFYVCLLAGPDFEVDGLIIRFGEDLSLGSDVESLYSGRRDRVDIGPLSLPVFEAQAGLARSLSRETGVSLAEVLGRLPWTVDLQIHRGALALYSISRNLDLSAATELALLTDVTCQVARILAAEDS